MALTTNKLLLGMIIAGAGGGIAGIGYGINNSIFWKNLRKEESNILWEFVEMGGRDKNCYLYVKSDIKEDGKNYKKVSEECRDWAKRLGNKVEGGQKSWVRVKKDLLRQALEAENLVDLDGSQEKNNSWTTQGMSCSKQEQAYFGKILVTCENVKNNR